MRKFFALVSATLAIVATVHAQPRPGYGSFIGPLDLRLDPNGRDATLLAPFGYLDAAGKKWSVPKGVTVNGASIPQVLWSIMGSPWTGQYREGSVIHDYYCDVRTEPWRTVHRTFYASMLANGVGPTQAKLMYAAVYRFGPRWNFEYTPKCANCLAVPYRVDIFRPEPNEKEFEDMKSRIEKTDLSLETIEKEADAAIAKQIQGLELGRPILVK